MVRFATGAKPTKAEVLPHPVLIRRFEEKVARLREALNDKTVHGEAMTTIRSLVHSVAICSEPGGAISADVEASTDVLLRYAQKRKKASERVASEAL